MRSGDIGRAIGDGVEEALDSLRTGEREERERREREREREREEKA